MKIGFNTSYTEVISLEEKTSLFLDIGCNAIEFSMSTLEREQQLSGKWEHFPWDKFEYCSLHAPARGVLYDNDEVTHGLLGRIQTLHDKYNFDLIVFHPNIVKDFSIFKNYNFPIAFENMDGRSEIARDVSSLKEIFSLVDAKMVLDLNHCYTNDSTMALANDFYRNFGEKIKEIHLSGYKTFHDLLYQTEQIEIIQAVPDKEIPIIIESEQSTIEDIKKEFAYITDILNK